MLLHGGKEGPNIFGVFDAAGGVGGGAGGVELAGGNHVALRCLDDFFDGHYLGEVKRHQRLKTHAGGKVIHDPRLIGRGGLDGGHRWPEIGHDDGPMKMLRGGGHGFAQ